MVAARAHVDREPLSERRRRLGEHSEHDDGIAGQQPGRVLGARKLPVRCNRREDEHERAEDRAARQAPGIETCRRVVEGGWEGSEGDVAEREDREPGCQQQVAQPRTAPKAKEDEVCRGETGKPGRDLQRDVQGRLEVGRPPAGRSDVDRDRDRAAEHGHEHCRARSSQVGQYRQHFRHSPPLRRKVRHSATKRNKAHATGPRYGSGRPPPAPLRGVTSRGRAGEGAQRAGVPSR